MAAALSLTAFGSAGKATDLARTKEPRVSLTCGGSGEGCLASGAARGERRVVKVGEACGPGAGRCQDPAFCDESLHCAVGEAERGQVCARHAECKAPFVCPWARHVCSSPGKIGQSCHTNPGGRSECETGAGCNGTKCVAQKADGQSCLADEECLSGDCQGGRCDKGAEAGLAERRGSAR